MVWWCEAPKSFATPNHCNHAKPLPSARSRSWRSGKLSLKKPLMKTTLDEHGWTMIISFPDSPRVLGNLKQSRRATEESNTTCFKKMVNVPRSIIIQQGEWCKVLRHVIYTSSDTSFEAPKLEARGEGTTASWLEYAFGWRKLCE